MTSHRVDEVYGVTRDVPLNYVERDSVDQKFLDSLSVDKHLIIFGSSKQGKTSLRKNSLNENEYILVQCQNTWTLEKLSESILKEVGYKIEISTEKTTENRSKFIARISAKISHFGSSEFAREADVLSSETASFQLLEIDPADPNDLVNAMQEIGFSKFIVLEDFHYLPKETQENFAFFLKTIHERSKICFIIVAVWREENRLIVLNGDLTGRVVSVDADQWTEAELRSVIERGENILNIDFPENFKSDLIQASLGSVYIVQEACRLACQECAVQRTEEHHASLLVPRTAIQYVEAVIAQSAPRYTAFLTSFAGGFQDTQLEMYRWLLYPVIKSSIGELENGIGYRFIRETLENVHPKGAELNPGNVTQALQSVPALQAKKDIKPFVLDYDQTNLRLAVVDRGFLIWLSLQDIPELLKTLGMPS
jgi:hypothetical protein